MAPGNSAERRRLANEYNFVSLLESLPVAGSIFRILIPLQKLPNDNQGSPSSSMTMFGSIAFQSSVAIEEMIFPWSSHLNLSLAGSSVWFVARPMLERLLPKVEAE